MAACRFFRLARGWELMGGLADAGPRGLVTVWQGQGMPIRSGVTMKTSTAGGSAAPRKHQRELTTGNE